MAIFSAVKPGKTDSHCGNPCDTWVCGENHWRMAMRDFGALSREPLNRTFLIVNCTRTRVAPVRFGYGLGVERFEWFRFSVRAVPLQTGLFCVSVQFNRKGRFRLRFLENGSRGSGSAFVIDLLMGLFRGAVFHHGENSPAVSMACLLSLMGRFPSLMGRLPRMP